MAATQSNSSAATVARIAGLASSSVVQVVQHDSPTAEHFASGLQHAELYSAHSAQINKVALNADPASELSRVLRATSKTGSATSLVSLLAQSNTHLLTSLVPQLVHVVATPTVLHIATQGDQSDVMALRSSGLVILHSSSPTQAHDHALLASRLAVSRSTAVLHFFDDQEGAVQDEITDADVHALLTKQTLVDGHAENGNGHTNGNSAEAPNGQSNGTATPRTPPTTPEDLSRAIDDAFKVVSDTVGRKVEPFSFYGSESASQLAVVLGAGAELLGSDDLAVIRVNLVRPLIDESLRAYVPASVTKVATLDQSLRRTTRISPLLVDVVTALQRAQAMGGVPGQDKAASVELPRVLISGTLGDITESNAGQASSAVGAALEAGQNGFTIGDARSASAPAAVAAKPPKHEEAYQVILQQLFNARLAVVNSPLNENDQSPAALSPEYAFGKVVAQLEGRESFDRAARALLQDPRNVSKDLQTALKQFTLDGKRDTVTAEKVQSLLQQSDAPASLSQLASSIDGKSRWIVGSDAWAYDVGMGGVHHVIASGKNVNMLIFDSLPYSERDAVEAHKRKKDIGLYAMNYGNVYVASTAVYANYTQVLQALMEADRFDGPSIVLAYVPYLTQDAPALDVLRETKLAVDSGYWPLYRWDPSAEKSGNEVFRLDSMRIRQQLNAFLERNNHLTLLANAKPELAYDLVSSQGTGLRERQRQKAKEAYDALLGAMDGPPLLILYASDGGNAEKVAKKLSLRAKARGLAARLLPMDDFPAGEELKGEKNVAFITSTAGQGEAPQNGRETMKTLNKMPEGSLKSDSSASSSASTKGDEEEEGLRFTVFAMGDSHYWPRAEDAHYYNKSGKDLDARLNALGAKRFVPLGLGDDQDADGYQTGYKVWEPLLWKALGVDSIEVIEAEPEPITNENIKIASNYLRGTILEGLADKSTGAIAESDGQLTKFHGTYQQYDRDTFDERKAAGLEPAYSFMIRCRIPAGVTTPAQWVQLDKVAGQYGNQTMKITTRQTIQYHCIVKSDLKAAMQGINKAMLDTIAACGDVNRNVMCSPNPHLSNLHAEVFEFSKGISEYLLPRMDAYHEIWLDKDTESKKELLMGGALKDYEPMYGPYYLPRKFKIAIAVPPRNDTDCFAHDIGLIAIADKKGHLSGFNVSVGGGMGVTHGVKATYPRLGDVIGFATTEQVKDVCKEIMLTQRDYGNRSNRKQARLKYTIDNHFKGPDNFRAEVERRLGYELAPARPYTFTANTDEYGWRKQSNGNWTCMLWLENGRIRDAPGEPFRTGVRELCLAKWFDGELRMTPNQHLALCEIKPEIKARVEVHLDMYNMVLWKQSAIATSASSCVAFPTCGLAMAESERVLFPDLVEKLDKIVKRLGLAAEEIITRMTGCPNGCARPWVAHIAFVGKAPETYLMLLGGNKRGTRINKVYAESVTLPEAIKMLEPMLERFAKEKGDGEDFGDFLIRVGIIAETKQGKDFWDGIRPLPLPVLATSG